MKNYVYWIYDNTCIDPSKDGYIGVTHNVQNRYKTHLRNGRVPIGSTFKILLESSREICFLYEKELRPIKNIGWNNAPGGSHGWQIGFSHTEETKTLLKEKWTKERKEKASKFRSEYNKKLKGQKRPKQSSSMTGSKNPIYGTKRPNNVKLAVSEAHKGKSPINKQENYCIGCHERTGLSNLKKYHDKCFKIFCEGVEP